jgi:hypothetical protein
MQPLEKKMNMLKLGTSGIMFSIYLSHAAYAETKWVPVEAGKIIPCLEVCLRNGGDADHAVMGGIYREQNHYFVCMADAEGLRAGFSVPGGNFANYCDVSHNGSGKALPPKMCLCSSEDVMAQ